MHVVIGREEAELTILTPEELEVSFWSLMRPLRVSYLVVGTTRGGRRSLNVQDLMTGPTAYPWAQY